MHFLVPFGVISPRFAIANLSRPPLTGISYLEQHVLRESALAPTHLAIAGFESTVTSDPSSAVSTTHEFPH